MGSVTPETVTDKPKSVLKQVVDFLKLRAEGTDADLSFEFVDSGRIGSMPSDILTISRHPNNIYVLISPISPMFDINQLNKFSSKLHYNLRIEFMKDTTRLEEARIRMPELKNSTELDKKGGIIFPTFQFYEDIGAQTNTAQVQITLDDPVSEDKSYSAERTLSRETKIIIYPNQQIRNLASVFFRLGETFLPKEFRGVTRYNNGLLNVGWGINSKQLEAIKRVTPTV